MPVFGGINRLGESPTLIKKNAHTRRLSCRGRPDCARNAMAERGGIFAGDDPFALARSWLAEAEKSEPSDADACALATVDEHGMPDVRMVLLRQIQDDGFVFFTNYDSAKGREIIASGKCAINFHWKSLRRQIRVRGTVAKADAATSDAYYASRALGSRIGAWASTQSQPLDSKSVLVKAVAAAGVKHGADPARPEHWGGFRITPTEIEFWANGAFRLHDRFVWRRDVNLENWSVQRLYP